MKNIHSLSLPALALTAAVLLAGCGSILPDKTGEAKADAHQQAMTGAEGRIPCAPKGRAELKIECSIDRIKTQDGLFLTIRHPEGGFRRLVVATDGRGVIAADGSEKAVVTTLGPTEIEVALGGARYRLPATVRPQKQ